MSSVTDREHLEEGLKFVVGGGIAVVGLVLYVQEVYFELSVTGRAGTFLGVTLLSLVAAATWTWKEGPGVVAALGVVAFVGYVALTHEGSRQIGLAFLVGCVVVLFVVTYLIQDRRIALTRRGGVAAAVVVLALLGGLVAVDFQDREVTHAVDFDDDLDLQPGDQAREVDLGNVTFHNDGPLRERVSFRATACLYTGDDEREETGVSLDGVSVFDHYSVGGQSSRTFDLTVVLQPDELAAFGNAPVELAASCPGSSDEPRVVVVVHDATGSPASEGDTVRTDG